VIILCAISYHKKLTIRLSDGKSILEKERMFDFASITEILPENGIYIHLSVIVNTTLEIILT